MRRALGGEGGAGEPSRVTPAFLYREYPLKVRNSAGGLLDLLRARAMGLGTFGLFSALRLKLKVNALWVESAHRSGTRIATGSVVELGPWIRHPVIY